MNALIETLQELIAEGEKLAPQGSQSHFEGYNGKMQPECLSWRMQAIAAIGELGPQARHILKDFENDSDGPYFYQASADRVLGGLQTALGIAQRKLRAVSTETQDQPPQANPGSIFVVHGHDQELLHQTARFLEKLDLQPIILFEQPSQSQTIIEKFEKYSNVRFAVILLTPDDVGNAVKEDGNPKPRARQNVILGLGYFLAKLGRPGVSALYYETVELPSDYRGVEYIKVDAEGAWKMKLARELKEAGYYLLI